MSVEALAQYNPFDPAVIRNPYPYYAWMREQSAVYRSPLPSSSWMFTEPGQPDQDVYVVTGYPEVVTVLDNPTVFTSEAKTGPDPAPVILEELQAGYPPTPTSFNTDPPEHAKKRRLIQRAMSLERMELRRPVLRATAAELVDGFLDDDKVELFTQFCIPFNKTVMFDLMGAPRADHPQLSEWNHIFEQTAIPGNPPDDERLAARELVAYQRYFEAALERRCVEPQNDVLTVIATAAPAQQRDMAETIWGLMVLVGAGQSTAADGLGNLLHLLLQDPDRWALLREQPELVAPAVEEGLRLEGPVQWMPRRTTCEVELGGVVLPAGSNIVVGYSGANRDPRAFPDPDRFDIQRAGAGPMGKHVAIGSGVHTCVGAVLARISLQVAVEVLLDRLPDLHLIDPAAVTYFPPAPMFRCVAGLPVAWGAR